MTEIIEMIKQFIKPELIVLVPVLYAIGTALKQSQKFNDNYIPALLGAIGVMLSAIYVASTSEFTNWQSVLSAIFIILTQGVLVASGSVYVDQLIKQSKKKV